jgi:pimeloyl-ACP methyl ester carboxylesterase
LHDRKKMADNSNPPDKPFPLPLPDGITSNYVNCPIIGLRFHYLESGYDPSDSKPLLLLLHGYPELAFSWRKVIPPLAAAGYHVVAPDQPGYGRTTGWDSRPYSQCDLSGFTMTRLVRDITVLVSALGYGQVHCVVGHDFGAVSAGSCALMRPDIFKSLVIMSHPWKAIPSPPFGTAHRDVREHDSSSIVGKDITTNLERLNPPRKHYKWYHSSPSAAQDMLDAPQGLKKFLRGYFHTKSADYSGNDPNPLKEWNAEEVAKMPEYYIMQRDKTMPETIEGMMKAEDATKTSRWLSDSDLDVYAQEWHRTGFQGGLNWYRAQTDPKQSADVLLFSGKTIDVPTTFISGKKDWGTYQQPGAVETIGEVCSDFRGVTFVEGAGHWLQQEQPRKVVEEILRLLRSL